MIGEEQLSIHSKKRKVAGEITLTDIETGKKTYYATGQCVHCQYTWQIIPGSGRLRGYCIHCQGMLCGQFECMKECVPLLARIEILEGNRKTIIQYANTDFVQKELAWKKHVQSVEEKILSKYPNAILL